MELKIPIEIVFDDINSVLDELGKLQKYKLSEGDDVTLVDVDDVVDVLTRYIAAREASAEPEIIHCRECSGFEDEEEDDSGLGFCYMWGSKTEANAFCSYAKRRKPDE